MENATRKDWEGDSNRTCDSRHQGQFHLVDLSPIVWTWVECFSPTSNATYFFSQPLAFPLDLLLVLETADTPCKAGPEDLQRGRGHPESATDLVLYVGLVTRFSARDEMRGLVLAALRLLLLLVLFASALRTFFCGT